MNNVPGTHESLRHLQYRMECMHRQLGEAAPISPEHFRARVVRGKKALIVEQDFRGGLSDDHIRQLLNALVFQIAHLKDLLKNWLSQRGRDQGIVEKYIDVNENLAIIIDLANVDKHGYPLRRFRSKHQPRIGEVGRVLRLETGKQPGSSATMTVDPATGETKVFGSGGGGGAVVFTGDVLDKEGSKVGDVVDIATCAVRAWQKLLSQVGVS